MANDKKFIAKNGFLTSDAESSFTNSTQATPTVTFTNSGGQGSSSLPGSGAVIAKFVGDSDAMVITNISEGDYFFGNNQQNNGINFYDGGGGMEFYYDGVEKFSIDSNGTTFATGHTTNGTTTTNRLKVEDNGSSSPLVVIKADDGGPWALAIGNDTYNTTEVMGHLFYQATNGDTYYQSKGSGAYVNWNFQQHDGSTSRTQLNIAASGTIELASNHYLLWGVGSTNRPGFLGDNTNKVLEFHNNGSERMRLDSSGNVGIGTTDPNQRFHAYHATTNVVGKIESGDDEVWLALTDVSTDTYGTIIGRKSSTNTLFKVADEGVVERFTILEGGAVGIGSTNPQYKLDVDGTSRVKGGLTVSPGSSGHTSFELGSRSADPLPAATGSYDFKPGVRVGSYELGGINAAADIAFAWSTDDISTSSPGYLAPSETYATASWNESFTVTQKGGTRWFVKVKLNDAESGNDPRLAVNNGTEYRLEYFDAVNSSGEAVNDSDTWHVIDVTDDIVTGNNVLKVWLGLGQKTYILAAYVFASTGIALPNEPAESTFYAHDGFGVRDKLIIDKARDMDNINTLRITGGSGLATLATNNNALNIGPSSGINLALDPNEIQARNNGVASDLLLQKNGGKVSINTSTPDVFNFRIATDSILSGSDYSWPFDITRAGQTNSRGFSIGQQTGSGVTALGNHNGDLALGHTYGADSNGQPIFYETMRIQHIDQDVGNVGIGTNSPDYKLHVQSASNQVAVFETTSTADMAIELKNSQGSMFFGIDGNENFGIGTDWDLNGATPAKFTVTSAGDVGIGKINPDSNLHIKSTGDVKLTLETDEDSDCWINLSGATSEASIGYEPASNSLRFANAADGVTSNVRMSIEADGTIDFQGVDGGTGSNGELERIKSAYFVNTEDDEITTTFSQTNGARLYFDHNFYSDQTRFSNVFSVDGGGFAYYGGDQVNWTAIYDTENTQYAIADWRGLNISQTKSTTGGGQALKIDYNITEPAADFAFAQYIDVDASGSGATGGDREQGGLRINFSSSTTGGDTADEHRFYGLHIDSSVTGDSDNVIGIYSRALSNLTAGQTTNLFGIDAYAEADNGTGTTISTAVAVRGNTYIDNAGSSANTSYGGYFRAYQYADGGSVTTAHGVYGELELNNTTAGNNYTTGYAFRAEIDNNTTRADAIGTSYLYYGNYAGILPTNAYGVFINDDVPNYFAGDVGIGTNSPLTTLHVGSGSGTLNSSAELFIPSGDALMRNLKIGHGANAANIATDDGTKDITFTVGGSDRMRITSGGNVGIGAGSPFSKLQVGGHTFSGGNGMYTDSRVGISNHGNLTGMMLASTYDDVDHPEYGLVFVQGPSTSNYNVWSISPDGPAKGDGLNFIYGNGSTNIHTGTPAVTFDGNGNVGIGTENPSERLEVDGGIKISNGNSRLYFGAEGGTSYRALEGNTGGSLLQVGEGYSNIALQGNVGIGTVSPGCILDIYKSTGTSGTTTGTTFLTMHNYVGSDLTQQKTFIDFEFTDDNANNWPQVRIGAEVGQNGDANSTIKEGSGAFVVYTNSAANSNAGEISGMAERFRVDYTGNVTVSGDVTAYYSDERLKDFEGKIDNALDIVSQINGYYYTGNKTAGELGYDTEIQQVGVISQEVEAVLPHVIKDAPINKDNGTDYKTVQYERLVPVLIEAVKELSAKVDAQQAEIDRLKGKGL